MTKAEAGQLGGQSTARKHGKDHMIQIGKKGALALHLKYKIVPIGTNDFVLVNRETGEQRGKFNGRR